VKVGDLLFNTVYKIEERVLDIRPGPFGGNELLIEMDEPFPYIGLPNPRRKIWMHESWSAPLPPLPLPLPPLPRW
jgi:hypothetical protein